MSELGDRRELGRVALAVLLPALAVASGFTPLNHAADVLSLKDRPYLVVLTPSVILAGLALGASILYPLKGASGVRMVASAAALLLVIGGAASITVSSDATQSTLLLVSGVLAPLVLVVTLFSADLPRRQVCWTFLLVTAAFFLRADFVFLIQNGLPTAETLLRVKFENAPYDFHYYSLGNPNYSSAFLVLPLALAAFWAADPGEGRRARLLLSGVALLMFANLVLVYVRFTIVVGAVVLLLALLAAPMARSTRRTAIVAFALALSLVVLNPTTLRYFGDILSPGAESSSVVRLTSIEDGLASLVNHPLTGVGLGDFGILQGLDPAHSSIVQSGAETGIAGALGVLVLTGLCLWLAWSVGRARRWRGLQAACAIAGAVFSLQAAAAAGPPTWLSSYSTAVWGLALGLVLAGTRQGAAAEGASRVAEAAISRLLAGARTATVRVATARAGPAWARRRPLVLLGYGLLVAALATVVMGVTSAHLGSARTTSLSAAAASVERGGPPLTQLAGSRYEAIDQDMGAHLVLPLVSRLTGLSPDAALGLILSIVFALALAAAPTLWWLAWRSELAAALAPLLLAGGGFLLELPGTAAVLGVFTLACLPVTMILWGRPSRRAAVALLLVAAAAGIASLLQPFAGMPILAAGLMVSLQPARGWTHRIGLSAAVLAVYLASSIGPVALAESVRDGDERTLAVETGVDVGATGDSRAALWQAAYFGLGWFDNRLGIESIADPANAAEPAEPYLSPDTIDGLRQDTLELAREDPLGTAWDGARKAATAGANALVRFPLVLVLVSMLVVLAPPSARRPGLVPLAGGVAVAALFPAIGSPLPHYEAGLVACVGVAWAWAAGGLAAGLERRSPWRILLATLAVKRRRLAFAGTAGVVASLLVTSSAVDRLRINPRVAYASGESDVAASIPDLRTDASEWDFRFGLPRGWMLNEDASANDAGDALRVVTSEGSGYQLTGPRVRLRPGENRVIARASVQRGAVYIGVLDVRRDRFLATARFSERQSPAQGLRISLPVKVERGLSARVVIGNWDARGDSTRVRIGRIDLGRPRRRSTDQARTRASRLRRLIERTARDYRPPAPRLPLE